MRRVRPAMQAMRRTAASRHAAKSARRSTCPTAPSDISARATLALAFFNHAHGFTLARVTPPTSTGCKLRVEIAVLGNSPCQIAGLRYKNGDLARGITECGEFNPEIREEWGKKRPGGGRALGACRTETHAGPSSRNQVRPMTRPTSRPDARNPPSQCFQRVTGFPWWLRAASIR